jgi:hypothetical protein
LFIVVAAVVRRFCLSGPDDGAPARTKPAQKRFSVVNFFAQGHTIYGFKIERIGSQSAGEPNALQTLREVRSRL